MSIPDPIDDLLDAGLAVVFGSTDRGPHPPPAAPTRLGDYRILHEIGRGGMGVVYLAEQTSLRRRVALKVLPAHLTLSQEAVARFRAEASSAARLRHPGIVRVHAVDGCEGHHFFAMEFVDGSPLHDVLRQLADIEPRHRTADAFARALARTQHGDEGAEVASDDRRTPRSAHTAGYVETVCDVVAQVADALQHAHDAGVVHRDVKPSNILVRADGVAVLTDFGLARDIDREGLTQTGVFAGTPHYASPERVRGGMQGVDHRTDVFSLGVTLYELLTAQRPFDGATTLEVLRNVEGREPPDPRRFHPRIPRDLVTIVTKALEKDPERRYARAGDFADDVRAFVARMPIRARPASAATRISKFVTRHRTGSITAAICTVAVVIALVTWLRTPGHLNVVSRPPGATVFVDGEILGVTPLERPIALKPGTYVVHLELPASALVGLPQEVTITQSRDYYQAFELLTPSAVLQRAVGGDEPARAWIQDPDPIRPEYAALRAQKHGELQRRLAAGEVDDIDRLAAESDLLSASGRGHADLESCRALLRNLATRERDVRTAIDDGRLDDAETRLIPLGAMTLAGAPFGPAAEAAVSLRTLLADAIVAACLAGGATPADCERARTQLGRLAPDHTGVARIATLQRTLETEVLMADWRGRALTATSARQVALILTEMEGRDADHPDVQEVRDRRAQLAASEQAEQDIERAVGAAHRSFRASDAAGVRAVRDELRGRAGTAMEKPVRRSLADAGRDVDLVLAFLDDLRAAEDRADLDSASAGLEALDADSLPTPLRADAASILARAKSAVAGARTRRRILDALQLIDVAVARLDLDAAHGAWSTIPDRPPTTLRTEIDRASRSIAELERRDRDRASREQEFAAFRSDVAAGRSNAAEQKLAELRAGWDREFRYVSAAIAYQPDEELLRRGARLALFLGHANDAESLLTRATGGRVPSARDLVELGRCRYVRARTEGRDEDLRAAWVRFQFAAVLDPADAEARAWRAVAAFRLGDMSQALRDLEASASPHSAGAVQLLLQIHGTRRHAGTDATREDPAEWEERVRGAAFTEDDFLARTNAHGTDGLGLELTRFRFHLLADAGVACLRQEDWHASRRLFDEALSIDETAVETRVGFALALAGLGEWSAARIQLARARHDAGPRWTPDLARELEPILEGPGGGR